MILGGRYFQLSNTVFCYELTPIQLAVYSYLCVVRGQRGKCWPAMKTIAACCGCSKNAARAAVDELERHSFIRRVPTYMDDQLGRTRQTNNTYYILELPDMPSVRAQPVYREGTTDGAEVYEQNESINHKSPT